MKLSFSLFVFFVKILVSFPFSSASLLCRMRNSVGYFQTIVLHYQLFSSSSDLVLLQDPVFCFTIIVSFFQPLLQLS